MTTPTPEKTVEEIVEKISKLIPCLDSYCDLHGTTIGGQHPETGEPEPLQCEYCYKARFPILDEIRQTLQAERQKREEMEQRAFKLAHYAEHSTSCFLFNAEAGEDGIGNCTCGLKEALTHPK